MKMQNVEKYKEFLEMVMRAKKDEYKDIKTILERFSTLEASQHALRAEARRREEQAKQAQEGTMEYEHHTNTRITILNNEISKTKKKQDEIA